MTEKETKLSYELMPTEFDDVVLVLMAGAKKYEARGWEQGKDFENEKNIASIKRHLDAYRKGTSNDSESGLHHLLHVACRALMQYTLDKRASENECIYDRDKPTTISAQQKTLNMLKEDNCKPLEQHYQDMAIKPSQYFHGNDDKTW